MSIHSPNTAFAITAGLAQLIRLVARQGEAINAALGELEHTLGVADRQEFPAPAPGDLLPDDNLLLLASELEAVAQRVKLRNRTLQKVRRNLARDDQRNVSRETSQPEAEDEGSNR